jgi:hypothetical protein
MFSDKTRPCPSSSPTIGIVTTLWSYYDFLPGWCESVKALNYQPDKIVIAAHDAEKTLSIAGQYLDNVETVQVEGEFNWAHFLNQAFEACDTDWIAWIGVDDRYRPCALNGITEADADLVAFGMKYKSNQREWHYGGNLHDWPHYNPIPPGSPLRRWLWEKIPFQTHLTWPDWGFWASSHFLGATTMGTGRVDYDYACHPLQQDDPPSVAAQHLADVCNWAATLRS